MKFAFMARMLKYRDSGIRTMLLGLLQGLSSIKTDHEIFIITDPTQNSSLNNTKYLFNTLPIFPKTDTFIGKMIWDHLSVGLECKKKGIDVLYAPAHIKPAFIPCPVVVQVLDMMYHKFPHYWNWIEQNYFRFAVSNFTSKATKVSALSLSTKQDILDFVRIPENKIAVIYPGIPFGFKQIPKEETKEIRIKFNLQRPYILFIGSFHPRKNLLGLIDAYENVAEKLPHDLVIKGTSNWRSNSVEQRVMNSPFRRRIQVIESSLSTQELAYLLNEADLFVFPSLYEGFGIPVLESIACGTPTITTNVSSMPEIVGDAAVLVPPGDISALSAAIYTVLVNPDLQRQLRQSSIIRSELFTWEDYTQKTLDLMEEAARCR
jgi:glycosyltransferase involved in cell wall biosynthesis